MNKRKLIYSSRVAKAISIEIPEFDWAPMTISNTFTRMDTGGSSMEKPPKGKQFDPKHEATRVFAVLDIEGQDELYIKELGVLNASEGFKECIIVNGDHFETQNGIECRCVGKSLEFRVV